MFNMLVGEVIFGGVGAGLYGMVLMVVLTVFLAGLMVGRTPEWLGKKIEAREVKLAALTLLVMPVGVLALAALPIVSGNAGRASAPGRRAARPLGGDLRLHLRHRATTARPSPASPPTRCGTTS